MVSKVRQQRIVRRSKKTEVHPWDVRTGHFVIRGELPQNRKSKLVLHLIGPYQVAQVMSDFIYWLEQLVTSEKVEAHGQ